MLRRIQYLLEAAAFFSFIGVFSILGLEGASAFGGWFARTIGPLTPLHARARKRLRRVMPETSEAEADRILRAMWDNLGRTIGELPHLGSFHPFQPNGRVELMDMDKANALLERDCGAIFVSGHFANWELMPMVMSRFGLAGGAVYRAPNNPYVDRYFVNLRSKYVCPIQIPKGPKGVRSLVQLLKSKGYLAMLVDQRMSDGIEVPFFGIPTMTPAAPAQLSLRHHIPIIPASIERIKGPNFRMRLYETIEPISTGDRDADIKSMMERVNLVLEQLHPSQPA